MAEQLEEREEAMDGSPHQWVQWVTGTAAQVLLWQLCTWIEDTSVSHEALRTRVQAWQRNAQKAVDAQSFTVRIDPSLGVGVDAWLYTLWLRMRETRAMTGES